MNPVPGSSSITVRYEMAAERMESIYDLFWIFEFPLDQVRSEFFDRIGSLTIEQFGKLTVPVDVMMRLSVVIFSLYETKGFHGIGAVMVPTLFYPIFGKQFPGKKIHEIMSEILDTDSYSELYDGVSCRVKDIVILDGFKKRTTLKELVCFPLFEFFDVLAHASTVFSIRSGLDLGSWIHAVILFMPLRDHLHVNDGHQFLTSWMWLDSSKTMSKAVLQAEKFHSAGVIFGRIHKPAKQVQKLADAPLYLIAKPNEDDVVVLIPEKIASPGFEQDPAWQKFSLVALTN